MFCVRNISSSKKCSSMFFATVQELNTKEFNNRHLLNKTKPSVATVLLNEIFKYNGSTNISLERKDHETLNILKASYSNLQSNTIQNILRFNDNRTNNINNQNGIDHIPRKSRQISFISSDRDHICLSNNVLNNNYHVAISNRKNNYVNYRRNLMNIGIYTKNKTKVTNSTILKNIHVTSNSTQLSLKEKEENKPSINNLDDVYNILCSELPYFFTKSMNYSIYHSNIEFINNLRGTATSGIYDYIRQIALVRFIGHVKYAYVYLEVLKITKHTEDNTIRVRWRINGTPGLKLFVSFWKERLLKVNESKNIENWYDGYSVFFVGEDGLIHKHIADKMMPDTHGIEEQPKPGLSSQVAFSISKIY